MIHRIEQHLAVHHVDVDMVTAVEEIAVEQSDQIPNTLLFGAAERGRDNRKGIADSVLGEIIRKFGNRLHRRHAAVSISPVHRICAGSKGLTRLPAVRRGSGLLPVHHVGGNGQN